MGKLVKVEIDDQFPISFGNELFVRSEEKKQLWPLIFSKAICKLNRYKFAKVKGVIMDAQDKEIEGKYNWEYIKDFNFDDLVGDGSVMYSLTGLIPETLELTKMLPGDWNKVQRLLNDEEYTLNSSYITCFSKPGHKSSPPSNKLKTLKDIVRKPNEIANKFLGLNDQR